MTYDVIILGAGAAGCMAAIQAGKRGKKVLLLEQGRRVGGKIPISGGGRCNFTNRDADATHYQGANPDFARSALARFGPDQVETWFLTAGIPYHEKKLGQLFCDRSAMDVVDMLENELKEAGVTVACSRKLVSVEHKNGVYLAQGADWEESAPKLVVALGGLSYPALGANDLGLKLAQQFGLQVNPTAPALDGFVFNAEDQVRFDGLPGLALDVVLSCGGHSYEEALLFTHQGLSGPAALQGSLWWKPGEKVVINLWPGEDAAESLLRYKRQYKMHHLCDWLATRWPRRLAERWDELVNQPGELNRISDPLLRAFAEAVQAWTLIPGGTVGWHKAEVTKGGVDTGALDQKTLECKSAPGLYFIGECVDITGELGGYNFQWAWSSGHACGMHL